MDRLQGAQYRVLVEDPRPGPPKLHGRRAGVCMIQDVTAGPISVSSLESSQGDPRLLHGRVGTGSTSLRGTLWKPWYSTKSSWGACPACGVLQGDRLCLFVLGTVGVSHHLEESDTLKTSKHPFPVCVGSWLS